MIVYQIKNDISNVWLYSKKSIRRFSTCPDCVLWRNFGRALEEQSCLGLPTRGRAKAKYPMAAPNAIHTGQFKTSSEFSHIGTFFKNITQPPSHHAEELVNPKVRAKKTVTDF
jgi:hypothetical protein